MFDRPRDDEFRFASDLDASANVVRVDHELADLGVGEQVVSLLALESLDGWRVVSRSIDFHDRQSVVVVRKLPKVGKRNLAGLDQAIVGYVRIRTPETVL